MTASLLTPGDLVSLDDGATTLGVPTPVVRLLAEGSALLTVRPRGAVPGGAPLLLGSELAAPDPELRSSLCAAQALWQYLTGCRPANRRDDADGRLAPLWVRIPGSDDARSSQGLALRTGHVVPWTLKFAEHKFPALTADIVALTAPWTQRRLVTLAAADRVGRKREQVSWRSTQVPAWVVDHVRLAGGLDA